MRLGSVCSGVGGMDMGLEAAGFHLAWLCEKDAQCRTVLNHRFPGVQVYDNLEGLADRDGLEPVQLLAGGTPCQDLSVAGRRAGLDGERSGLFFEFIRLADRLAPDWLLWENVDGALSSSDGEDFAVCLEGFTGFRPEVPGLGWRSCGVAVGPLRWCVWRVLDAQWFGVAQRRARVFVVAGTGEQPRPEVLLEPESVSGDSAPSRTQGEGVADDVALCLRGQSNASHRADSDTYVPMISPALKSRDAKGPSSDGDGDGAPIVAHTFDYCPTCGKPRRNYHDIPPAMGGPCECPQAADLRNGAVGDVTQSLQGGGMGEGRGRCINAIPHVLVAHTPTGNGHDASEDGTRGTPIVLAFGHNKSESQTMQVREEQTDALQASPQSNPAVVAFNAYQRTVGDVAGPLMAVVPRRLTPGECEKLMSWPVGWTDVNGMKDSPRYRMIGNGVVSNVARWIGERIAQVSVHPAREGGERDGAPVGERSLER